MNIRNVGTSTNMRWGAAGETEAPQAWSVSVSVLRLLFPSIQVAPAQEFDGRSDSGLTSQVRARSPPAGEAQGRASRAAWDFMIVGQHRDLPTPQGVLPLLGPVEFMEPSLMVSVPTIVHHSLTVGSRCLFPFFW